MSSFNAIIIAVGKFANNSFIIVELLNILVKSAKYVNLIVCVNVSYDAK